MPKNIKKTKTETVKKDKKPEPKPDHPQEDGGVEPKAEIQGSAVLEISVSDILNAFVAGYGKKNEAESKKKFNDLLSKRLKQIATKHGCASTYNVLIIFDNTIIVKSDADRVYKAVSSLEKNNKPLLLILLSGGGEPGSAFLIGKLCRESCNNHFVVVVPRYAKSAATLLSMAANEIHMGSLSELGPIDPQIKKMPALGLKNSVEHIAELAAKNPGSAEMFAKYLYYSIEPVQIGYYERAAKSAEQYAVRLLESHKKTITGTIEDIAWKLVYEYKDHGFVIDKTEAEKIFGKEMIKVGTPEYELGNEIYNELSKIEEFADLLDYKFYFIGTLDSSPELIKNPN